ncbi:hypothetical protein PCCS19_29430 [Paenibacillus sp. CCS19]|uniref:hypothetical protein n=1 Tax=Paenibacillus sp. CCS19 TaxID=3158387 RepID=UPI002566585D|nr:hypothetical protein [Paenibacillus cellulosilyticus]GMK39888.1 hypothetical protein PCCS19_29430 [Paenibacillus cellulosilyticus]
MRKPMRGIIALTVAAALVPAMTAQAASPFKAIIASVGTAHASSNSPISSILGSLSQGKLNIQSPLEKLKQSIADKQNEKDNGKDNSKDKDKDNSKDKDKDKPGNGNGNGNNGNGNGNNGNGNSGNNGNGNGNGNNNGNGNGNNGNSNGNGNGNGNGNSNNGNGNNDLEQIKKEQEIYNDTGYTLVQLRNACQAELTGYAVQFTKLTSTHEKTVLYSTASDAFTQCTSQYRTVMDAALVKLTAIGGDPALLEPMQTRYQEEIVAGRAQLKAIVGK